MLKIPCMISRFMTKWSFHAKVFLLARFQKCLVILFVPYGISQTIKKNRECKQENKFDHAFQIHKT